MSLSYQPLEPVLVKDPRCIIDNKRVYAILKAGRRTTYKRWTTNSISTSNINFTTPPPSSGIIIDRKITLTLPVRLTYTARCPADVTGWRAGFDAPRAFPIHSMIDTIQLTINNCAVTQNIGEIIHALLRYNNDDTMFNKEYSETPTTLDNAGSYNSLYGSNLNVLGAGNSVIGRGNFCNYKLVTNESSNAIANRTVVVDFLFTEQIMISPLYWGKDNASGFTNVTSMDWVFNFLSQAYNRVWSHAEIVASPITGENSVRVLDSTSNISFGPFSTTVDPFSFNLNQPTLNITYITPDTPLAINPNIPISYPYFSVNKYVTDQSDIAYGATTACISNNIQLPCIPRRLYIYARPINTNYYGSPAITDTYYSIESLSLQFENYAGLFAEASKIQLYEISKKNHCNMSWSEWSGDLSYAGPALLATTVANSKPVNLIPGASEKTLVYYNNSGSVMCIEFASDIGLDPSECPGVGQGTYNLQVQCVLKNNNIDIKSSGNAADQTGNTFRWESLGVSLYVIAVLEGTFTITQAGSAMKQLSVVSVQDVEAARANPAYNYRDVQDVNGGNFMSGLKQLVPRALSGIKKANNYLKDNKVISRASDLASYIPGTVGDVARDVGDVARKYGYGYEGGKAMTKKQLQNRLKNR